LKRSPHRHKNTALPFAGTKRHSTADDADYPDKETQGNNNVLFFYLCHLCNLWMDLLKIFAAGQEIE
jgi:hypothetical protein